MSQLPTLTSPPAKGALFPFVYPQLGATVDQTFGWSSAADIAGLAQSTSATDGTVIDCNPVGGVDMATDASGWSAAVTAAVQQGRRIRLKAGNHAFATDFSFPVGVVFERGAIITHFRTVVNGADPSDSATVTFADRLFAAPDQQIFQFTEVREAVNISPVQFNTPQEAFFEWWGINTRPPALAGYDGDWSYAIQAAADAFRVGGVGGVVSPGTPGKTYLMRWGVVFTGIFSQKLFFNLGGSRFITDQYRANRGYGGIFFIGNSSMATADAYKYERILNNLNTAPNFAEPSLGAIPGNGNGFIDPGPPGRATNGAITEATAAAYSYPSSWTNLNAQNIIFTGPGSIEYFDDVTQNGGYGVQFANAKSCRVQGYIEGRNCNQLFGFGSDEYDSATQVWESPYCYDCHVDGMWSTRVSKVDTFYSGGFWGFAGSCTAKNIYVTDATNPASASAVDGNGFGFLFANDCHLSHFYVVGGKTSAGNYSGIEFSFASMKCTAMQGEVINFFRGLSHYAFAGGGQGSSKGNTFSNIAVTNCNHKIYVDGHYCTFVNCNGGGNTDDLYIGSVNGNNIVYIGTRIDRITNSPWSDEVTRNQAHTSWDIISSSNGQTAAGAANTCNIGIFLKRNGTGGTLITHTKTFKIWVGPNGSTTGAGILSTAPSTGFAISAGVVVDKKSEYPTRMWEVQCPANGQATLTYVDTAKTPGTVWVEVDGNVSGIGNLAYG